MILTHSSPGRLPSQPLSLSRSIPRAPAASLAPNLLSPPLPRRPGNLARRRRRPMTSQHSAHRRPPKRTRERARLLLNLRTCLRLYSSLNNLPHQPLRPNPRNASGTPRRPPPNLSLRALLLGNRHPPTRVLKARRPSSPRKKGSEEQGRMPLWLLLLQHPQQTRLPLPSPAHLSLSHSVSRYKDLQHSSIDINLPNLVPWVGSMILWLQPAKLPQFLHPWLRNPYSL